MTSKVQAASKAHGQHKGKQPDGEDKIKNDDGTRVGGRNASKVGVGTPIWGRNKRLRGKKEQREGSENRPTEPGLLFGGEIL